MKIYIAQTIDGYIAGPDGSLDHLEPFKDNDYGYEAFIQNVNSIIMGRNTLDSIYDSHGWPYPVNMPSVILTHRPLPTSLPPYVQASDSIEETAKNYPNSYVDGAHVISQFLARNLVRDAQIFTLPVMLGTGIRLFPDMMYVNAKWELTNSQSYSCGTVKCHYRIP